MYGWLSVPLAKLIRSALRISLRIVGEASTPAHRCNLGDARGDSQSERRVRLVSGTTFITVHGFLCWLQVVGMALCIHCEVGARSSVVSTRSNLNDCLNVWTLSEPTARFLPHTWLAMDLHPFLASTATSFLPHWRQ